MPLDYTGRAEQRYQMLVTDLEQRGFDLEDIEASLKTQKIETPSWGYSNSGTRFATFPQLGAARNIHERLQDAAQVHRLTGICPAMALHIPWDAVEDYAALKQEAQELDLQIGTINPNLFQDADYQFGSLTHMDERVRQKALKHILACVEIMKQVGSSILSLWFADGTDYPGQDDFCQRKRWMEEGLRQVYAHLPGRARVLIEYKPFEPAFYHTDIADWGMAYVFSQKLGSQAQVLVDLGHHFQGANVEHIVAFLLDEAKLGGFHFNNRKYADDDLTSGSINPYEIFLIYKELVFAEKNKIPARIVYMIDQSHITKSKIEAMIQSVMNLQRLYAKALLIERKPLAEAQATRNAVDCERILQRAFNTDVEPLLQKIRQELGCADDPLEAYRQSGYWEKIVRERQGKLAGTRGWMES